MQSSYLWPAYAFPTENEDVSRVKNEIIAETACGRLKSVATGFLLSTSCTTPMIVTIPLDLGLKLFRSIDDLYTASYIFRLATTGLFVSDHQRVHINRFPIDSDSYLANPFTFSFCGQHEGMESNNFVENYTVRSAKITTVWSGNILIVKHARPIQNDLGNCLVDVEGDDLLITKQFNIGYINYPPPERRLIQFPYLRSTRRKSIALPVFGHRDLREIVFRYCSFVYLSRLSTVCTELHRYVSMFFGSRVRTVLSFAFDHPLHKPFMKFLDRYQSFIVGSGAYQILDPHVNFRLNNLNIVAVCGSHSQWVNAFLQLGCVVHDVKPRMREELHRFVDSHICFLTPKGLPITLTVAKGDSISPLFLCGYTTAEAVAVGSHFAYSFYPDLLEQGFNIPLNEVLPFSEEQIRGLNLRSYFSVDNATWSKACGCSCPVLPRRTRSGVGIMSLCWRGLQDPRGDCYEPNWAANTFLYRTVSDASLPTLIMDNTCLSLQLPVHHVRDLCASGVKTSLTLFADCLKALQKHRGTKHLRSQRLDYPSVELALLFPDGTPPILTQLELLSICCSVYQWSISYTTVCTLLCPTLKHLNLNFSDVFFPPSYAQLAECFWTMPVAVPALTSLQIGLPTCYTPAELPVLQQLFHDISFTFPQLLEFDLTCDENSIAFASFLLRHPNITTLGIAIGRSENMQDQYHSATTSYKVIPLDLSTVLRSIPTLENLFVETNIGLTLGHLRVIISERPNLKRFSCKIKSGDPDDEFLIVATAYDIVLNNLPHLREFGVKFANCDNDQFRLQQKQAIRSALRVHISSPSLPLTIKVYAAASILPAVTYRGNCLC
ncbi:hypothetical protein C8J55DRAFT_554925 [Lentinula edodes]|uniref:Uncharacterized protein n=1 Tax=Lentinula lateritia TaxID=40482 RepID=A0A9W9E0G9_9AGAR|nr:hypothetical protein C8J55DRAFT_554925 [Lentinula edodes]